MTLNNYKIEYRNAELLRITCCLLLIITAQCVWALAPVNDSKIAPIKPAVATQPDPSILSFTLNPGTSNLTINPSSGVSSGPLTFSGFYTNSTIQGTKKSSASLVAPNNSVSSDDSLMDFKVAYKNSGLAMSAEINETGQKFLGFGDTVKKLKAFDPNSANMLAVGTKKTDFNLSYNGIKGLSMSSNLNTVTVDQTGNASNGMTRTINNNNIGSNWGQT